ncbi:MAG: chromosomal replication initiator protein DnaA [Pseudomonadota bacterium]
MVNNHARKKFCVLNKAGDHTVDHDSIQVKWARIKSRLRASLGEDVFTSWFARVELEEYEKDQNNIHLSVPTRFLKNWLESHYLDRVVTTCKTEFEDIARIKFSVRQPRALNQRVQQETQTNASKSRPSFNIQSTAGHPSAHDQFHTGYEGFEGSPLDKRFKFDSFIIGSSNRMAHAAAWQVAESVFDKPLKYNPLFIHSSVGLGKTHLLHAIAWEVKKRNPNARVLYLTAERFMYSFVEALRSRDAISFKDKLRGIDILLIDDMEFLQGRTIQQEFGHTLNSLIDGGKQVVVASDRTPILLESLDARMRSRLGGGLVTEIGNLDYELRLKILAKRAAEKKNSEASFNVNDTVLEFLASRLTESGRELEGAITRIYAAYQLTEQELTVEVAEDIIRDLMRGKEPKRVKIDDILRIVSKHYGISRGDILSQRRNRSIVWPRQIGMFLAKNLTSRSLPEIGRRFGGRDHTTVLHAIRKIEGQIADDVALREEIEILKRLLKD